VVKVYETAAGDFPALRAVWVMVAAMRNQFGGHAVKTE
jgi:6-phosphogluconate dehydrogenase (decarboxylating)